MYHGNYWAGSKDCWKSTIAWMDVAPYWSLQTPLCALKLSVISEGGMCLTGS